ncbi:hypothetical protein MK079_01140 [Candidatus Gracilibacteria bacterium]|nr:hypothetical protein [Candidatus Gracilibacteria bacterium]
MKKNILITCALPVEMKAVKKQIKGLGRTDVSFSFLTTGVGNMNTALSMQEYILTKEKPDFIINIGVCGKASSDISDDLFQVYRIFHAASQRESICPVYVSLFNFKSLLCSDRIITDYNDMQDEVYVDMESQAIDTIATKYTIPYVILKQPFDTVSHESKKVSLNMLGAELENIDYSEIIHKVSAFLDKNHTITLDFEQYKQHFLFTVAEQMIFIKKYHKMQATGGNFEKFFEKNKTLSKKVFLEEMS